MDGKRFDEFTRLIGTGGSRRRVLKGLTWALLGVSGLAVGRSASAGAPVCGSENAACGGELDPDCCDELACFSDTETCKPCLANDEACAGSWECCSGFCDGGSETCQDIAEPTCAGFTEDCTELECCDDLVCVSGGLGTICISPDNCPGENERCAKGMCCPGLECIEGFCLVVCSEVIGAACTDDDDCCSEAGLTCAENVCTVTVCREADEACGVGAPCCDGLECNESLCAPPVVEPECETDADCVVAAAGDIDPVICCGGVCRQIECCIDDILGGGDPNARCDEGETCFEGVCAPVCQGDVDCADDACCCDDGSCSGDCCPDPVVELPSTGVADGAGGMGGLMGAGLAAGAAALLAGTKLRANEE
jgi:hypothetical protein